MAKAEQAVRRLALVPILVYRYAVSPFLAPSCRFHPSCSEYAVEAIKIHGVLRGGWLSIKRLGKCHPWHAGGADPVPPEPKPSKVSSQ